MSIRSLESKTYTAYAIQHRSNKKIYVGVTCNIQSRLKSHLLDLRSGRHCNKDLQKDFDTHGEDFEFYELENNIPYKDRMSAEGKWILKLNSQKKGYNRDRYQRGKPKELIQLVKGVPEIEES